MILPKNKEIIHTDGKRYIVIQDNDLSSGGVEIVVCRNGFQSVSVTMDYEMLDWLRSAIDKYSQSEKQKGAERPRGETFEIYQ